MADKILNSFDVWIGAQGWKSKLRLKSVDNISLEGIARLRELILELAIQGRLVSQSSTEEPAPILLKRIAAKRQQLINDGTIKQPKRLLDTKRELNKYPLPSGWLWANLDHIAPMSLCDGDWVESKDQDPNGKIRLIQLADIGEGTFLDKSNRFINEDAFERLDCTKLEKGDVLIARLPSPIGRACIFPGMESNAITVVDVAILRSLGMFCETYIVNAINSRTFRSQVEEFGKGTTRFRISTGNLKSILIPIPPLAEQHRIVAKVDELMALCDELEQQETNHLKTHQLLVETLLGTLTQAKDAAEFETAWSTLAQHFDDLFITEDSIDQLKQTILQLAVMGKLVKQDPEDEPASVLWERIRREKERLIEEGQIKKQEKLEGVLEDQKPYSLPNKWIWTKLGNLSANIHYGYTASANELIDTVRLLRITDIQNDSVNWSQVPGCEIDDKQIDNYFLEDGDILIARTGGTIGKSYLVSGITVKAVFASYLIRVQKIDPMYPNYIKIFLGSQLYWKQLIDSSMGTGQPNVNGNALKNLVIPLPPLEEQHRIVVKVDELLALCDVLKARITESQKAASLMADSILEQVV